MRGRKHNVVESWYKPGPEPICPLCGRSIPKDQKDDHHLVPRLKGGKETQTLHRICHRQVHALFTEAELAGPYATVEALLERPEVQKFVRWVKTKSPGFIERTKMSRNKR